MKVLVLNPNTSAGMTAHVVGQLQPLMPSGTQLLPCTAQHGAAVIADAKSFLLGGQAALDSLGQLLAQGLQFDAVLLACFGDPALEALRLRSASPVVGLAQTSLLQAEREGLAYAVVTAGPAWQALLEERFAQWGATALFRGVHVLQGTGLDVMGDPSGVLPAVQDAIARARAAGAQRIILGGAVFAGYPALMRRHGVDTEGLIDCLECAASALLA